MSSSSTTPAPSSPSPWKTTLQDAMDPQWADEIDQFEGQIELRKQDKIEDKVFAETRLRRGVYGQRYDNGQRHDGFAERRPSPTTTCPPRDPTRSGTRPACSASRSPSAASRPSSSRCSPTCAEEYSDSILHVTTRQDIQLHFVHIEDTPDLMRRLAAVGITTREACGNSVRNVTGVPARRRLQDRGVRRLALRQALMRFLLGHPDVQDFGRKFKPAFSGCETRGLRSGADARRRLRGARSSRTASAASRSWWAAVSVPCRTRPRCCPSSRPSRGAAAPDAGRGAGLRAPGREEEPRPRAHQVPGGEASGIEEFQRSSWRRSARSLPHDERWTAFLDEMPHTQRRAACASPGALPKVPICPPVSRPGTETNVLAQRQEGYAVVIAAHPSPAGRHDGATRRGALCGSSRASTSGDQPADDGGAEHDAPLRLRRRTCPQSTRSCVALGLGARPGLAPSWTSPPAPAPIPASSGSRPAGVVGSEMMQLA